MRTDFNAYLNEQKKQNLYSSKMDEAVIKEGLFGIGRYNRFGKQGRHYDIIKFI